MTTASNRRLVLVVDTDASFAEDARQLLSAERVLTVRTIEEAAEIVVGGRVDLALLGPSFGNESAVNSAGLLREADPGLTAVLVANIVTNRILLASLRSGLVDVVDTPLTSKKLNGILERTPARRGTAGTVILEATPVEVPIETPVAPAAPVASEPEPPEAPAPAETESPQDVPTAVEAPGAPSSPTHEPVTLTFEALSSLSTPVAFDQVDVDDAVHQEPPAGAAPEPGTETAPLPVDDAWAVPIESVAFEVEGLEPAPPESPSAERHVVSPENEQVDPPAQPPAVASETPPAPSGPAEPPPPYFEQTAFAPLATPDPAPVTADIPPPPPFEPPRRPPVDLERIGVLPADGTRRQRSAGAGHVVAVMAGKGGSGKTITATNLAMALTLQRGEDTVVIVDADIQFGDVALMLQLDPARTLGDAVSRIDELTDARLDGMLLRHESGLRVMAAPLHPAPPESIPAKGIVEVIERLRGMYEVVVVDTPPIFDDNLVTVLEDADDVFVVVDMDLPSVKNAKIALDALRAGRFPMERVRLVVNRANAKARLDLVELERSLGLRVAGSIPSDRLVPQSVNEGVPVVALSPRSRVARAFHSLADLLALPDPRRNT